MKPIINIKNLSVGYPAKQRGKSLAVLSHFSAVVNESDFIALIGRNGSGKSTLLRTLANQQTALSGSLSIKNVPYQQLNRQRFSQMVSFVSTDTLQVPHMTVYELVSLGRFPYTNWFGKITPRDHELIVSAIQNVGIDHLKDRPINKISDGERQRAVIARTLAQDTEIMILDEPTAFLDLPNRYEIYQLLHRLSRHMGKSIILSTHDLNMALYEADKIWLLNQEQIVEGAPEDLILKGEIEKLIQNSQLHFDINTGSFRMKKVLSGNIRLLGDSSAKIWTCKALERMGYAVDSHARNCLTITETKDGFKWTFTDNEKELDFYTIYDLSLYLNNLKSIKP